jgi:hypothetical protein
MLSVSSEGTKLLPFAIQHRRDSTGTRSAAPRSSRPPPIIIAPLTANVGSAGRLTAVRAVGGEVVKAFAGSTATEDGGGRAGCGGGLDGNGLGGRGCAGLGGAAGDGEVGNRIKLGGGGGGGDGGT